VLELFIIVKVSAISLQLLALLASHGYDQLKGTNSSSQETQGIT
jgi:hypothetical protein